MTLTYKYHLQYFLPFSLFIFIQDPCRIVGGPDIKGPDSCEPSVVCFSDTHFIHINIQFSWHIFISDLLFLRIQVNIP